MIELLKAIPQWKLRPDEKSMSRQFSTNNFVAGGKVWDVVGLYSESTAPHPLLALSSVSHAVL
jgi:pterin-4a-carbinolamine dehydratase